MAEPCEYVRTEVLDAKGSSLVDADRSPIAAYSEWVHDNGVPYTVLLVTNLGSSDKTRFPPMVVYQGRNGRFWSRPLSEWYNCMKKRG